MEDALPPVGAVLAKKYRVDSVLGTGGMGVVLAATHLHLHEQVAIKLLRGEAGTRPDAVARFLREARIAMKMRGEHVVRVHDVGTLEDGAPFIAMECLKGSDFAGLIRAEGPLPTGRAVDYVLQACEGLAEAHALGVVHRDLKPANLFLTWRVDGSPCVKVLDFGVSKIGGALYPPGDPLASTSDDVESRPRSERMPATHAGTRDGMTRTRALLGSPRYMAPEQLRSPRDVDMRADVWALGAILFELVSGDPPFVGETVEELTAIIDGSPPPPMTGAPAGLDRVVHACLQKDRSVRCATVADLVELLAPFASGDGAESVKRVRRMAAGSVPPTLAAVTLSSAPPGKPEADHPTQDAVVQDVRRPIRRASLAIVVMAVGLGASVFALRARSSAPNVPAAPEPVPAQTAALAASQAREPAPSQPAAPDPATPSSASDPAPTALASVRSSTHAPAQGDRLHPKPPPTPSSGAPASTTESAPDPLKLDAGFLFVQQK